MLEPIKTVAAVVSAAAAVIIPLVLHDQLTKNREQEAAQAEKTRQNDRNIALQARTLDFMQHFDDDVSKIIAEKAALDVKNMAVTNKYDHSYIKNNVEVESKVFQLLNKYEIVCLGIKADLLDKKIVLALREDAMKQTFADYRTFIEEHRRTQNQNARAWTECADFTK